MYRRALSIALTLLALTSCGGMAATSQSAGRATPAAAPAGAGATTAAAAGQPADAEHPAAANNVGTGGAAAPAKATSKLTAQQFGRKVILNATMSLLVNKADETEQNVRALVQNLGGYVLQSQTSGDEDRRSVHLTVKVPAARFDDALNALESKTFAIKVLGRSVSGQDVTDEFVDTESRLRNLKATEARLLDFLNKAKSVEEALQVNQQLTELQGQIEQASGRIKFLSESTAFSTISLDLQPDVPLVLAKVETWRPGIAASSAWHNLLAFAQGLADAAIVLAIWSPVWGSLLLLALIVWRRLGHWPAPPQAAIQP